MVDIVTNRMFDTFNKLAPKDSNQNESLSTITQLKRFSVDQRYRRALNREAEIRARENQLYEIKENLPHVALSKQRPLMGLSCISCTPTSRDSLINKTTSSLALKSVIEHNAFNSKNGFLQKTFSHLCQAYSLKKFDYPQVVDTVLADDRLKNAIEKTAIQQFRDSDNTEEEFYQELLKNNEKRAKTLLKDMRSTISDFLLRFTSWVLYKLLPCFLSSVVVHSGQIEMLKKAGNSGQPLIFLPLHKSHLDYILVSFILNNNNIRCPLVAGGDNLRIPFFGSLLRGLGAFFIKRRVDPVMGRKDHVYKAVLHTYMNACLRAGHNIEFFLEGGRTRTGKPCMPKYGILSVLLDAFMDGTIEDALLVPVSMNYEKLVDGNFIREQLGQPKEMETFGAAVKGIWHVLNSNYGMMRIDFSQPFSMRELVKTFNKPGNELICEKTEKKLESNRSTTSLYGTDIVADEHKYLVESISKHVLYDCANSTSIMCTNALAFLLLHKFRTGAKLEELVLALDALRTELACSNRDIGFSGDSIDVVNYAVEILGPGLVCKEKINNEDVIKPISMLPNVIELSYYSNTLVTYYALDSIIAAGLHSLDRRLGSVLQYELMKASVDLCDLMQCEFIFCKPCQNMEIMILDCIENLGSRKEIFSVSGENSQAAEKNRRIAEYFEDPDEARHTPVQYILNQDPEPLQYMSFLRGLLMPFIEAYSATAVTLNKLVKCSLLENELVEEVLTEMRRQIDVGTITCEESVSSDSVKNALKVFQKWEILDCHTQDKLKLYYLRELHDNSESVIALCGKINKYRYGF